MVDIAERLGKKFDEGLPEYLKDYFNSKDLNDISNMVLSDEEFWEHNKTEIVKKRRHTDHPVFQESPRNKERVEEERNLSQDEINYLIKLCEGDMYLFAIRYFPHYLQKPSSSLHKFIYNLLSTELNNTERTKGLKWAIAAPRAHAKCENGNTNVLLKNGTTKKLKDLNIGDKLQSLNCTNLKLQISKVLAKEHSGKKECIKITTRTNKSIEVTPEHKIFTFDGWKKAKDLTKEDRIASPRRIISTTHNTTLLDEEVKLIAYLIAEGCLVGGNSSFTNADKVIVEDFKSCCTKLNFNVRQYPNSITYGISTGVKEWCQKYNLLGHSTYTKRIPSVIFSIPNRQKKLFIAALIDTDGWVLSKYNGKIGITLANKKLIDDIYYLLLQLGINSYKYYRPNDKAGAWALLIDQESLSKFKSINCILKKDKIINLFNKKRHSLIDIYPNYIKKFYINVEREFREHKITRVDNKYDITRPRLRRMIAYKNVDEWRKFEKADVFWDKIKKIENCGICDTYDIQVEGTSNFIGNGLVTHNSSIVSAILPLWCICYNKKKFIVLVSNTASQAEDFLADIKRELTFNEKLNKDFPHISGQGPIWRANEIITTNDIKMLALGSGNQIRGRRFGIARPDLIIGDDMESSEDIRSESRREFLRDEWFDKDVLFAGGDDDYLTDFFVVGTILGSESLLNALVTPTEYPDWKSKVFKAVIKFSHSKLWDEWSRIYSDRFNEDRILTAKKFFEEHIQEMLEGTEVLWPEGDPYYNNMIVKYFRPSAFSTEKMNTGIDPTKILIMEDQLHFARFSDPEISRVLNNKKQTVRYGALDPSLGKKSDSGDFCCIVTLVKDLKSGYLFVEDIMLDRVSVENQIKIIIDYHMEFSYHLFSVETNAFQYVVAENLRKESRKSGALVPIKELDNYLDKKLRFEGIIPFLVDGTIIFNTDKYENNQQYANAIDQLCLVTGKGDSHDDVFDALEMAVRVARKRKFKRLTKQNRRD